MVGGAQAFFVFVVDIRTMRNQKSINIQMSRLCSHHQGRVAIVVTAVYCRTTLQQCFHTIKQNSLR